MAEDEDKKEEAPENTDSSVDTKSAEASSETGANDESASKKKNTRLFTILTLVNILFLGWLVFTMKYQIESPDIDESERSETVQNETELTDEEAVASELEPEPESIIMEPFLVNVLARHNGQVRKGQKVLRIQFEVVPESETTEQAIEINLPRIRDSVNILLAEQDYAELSQARGRVALRTIIQKKINEIIQPEKITDVYFITFVVN